MEHAGCFYEVCYFYGLEVENISTEYYCSICFVQVNEYSCIAFIELSVRERVIILKKYFH